MKTRVLWFGMVLVALATLPLLGGGTSTGKARPFKAKSVGYIVVDNVEANGTYDFVMNGQATHLGKFTLPLTPWAPVFAKKVGWRGACLRQGSLRQATREVRAARAMTRQRSVRSEPRSQTGWVFGAFETGLLAAEAA